jgi:PAS domain S-box-containing protein/putative nucleotidyltransferase with HDIG domain
MTKKIPTEKSKPKPKAGNPQSLRVLMIEDSENDALLIIRTLKKGGYSPLYERLKTAAAMKKALKEKQWDIILCDYKLPRFNAPSALATLKEANIDIPIIIVSGTIGEETAIECMRLGAQDYIMKGNLSRLCPAIARELEETESRRKRKQVENKLKESESRFRNIIEQSKDGIILFDGKTRKIILGNTAMAKLLGCSKEELVGRSIPSLHPSKEWKNIEQKFQKHVGGELSFSAEIPTLRDDGSVFYADISTNLITLDGIVFFSAFFRDITERKQVEKIILRSENRFKILYQENPIPMFTWQKKGDDFFLVEFNRAAILLTEGKANNYIGRSALELYRKRPDIIDDMRRCFKEQSIISKELVSQNFAPGKFLSVYYSYVPPDLIIIHAEDITERKRVEFQKETAREELQKSEEKYRNILESIEEGYYEVDLAGNLTFFNDSICRVSGYPREELMGMNNRRYMDEYNAKKLFQAFNKVYRTEKPVKVYDYEIIKKNGIKAYIATSISLRKDSADKKIGFRGIIRDITEHVQAESQREATLEVLRESEALYRSQFEDHAAIKLLLEPETGKIFDANEAAANFYGWSREELRQMRIQEINTLPAKEVIKAMETVSNQGRVHFEFRHRKADGSIRDVDVFSSKIKSKGKNLLHSIIHDITDRKKAESQREAALEALSQSEEKYRLVAEAAHDFILTADLNFKITFANKSVIDFMGGINLLGMSLLDLSPPNLRSKQQELMKMRRAGNDEVFSYEWEATNNAGNTIIIDVRSQLLKEKGMPAGILVIARDITERKNADSQREAILEELHKRSEELQTIIESSPIMIYFKDTQNRFISVNNAVLEISGLSREEIEGKSNEEINPSEAERLWGEDKEIIATGKPKIGILETIKTRRGLKRLQTDKIPFKDKEGKIIGIIGFSVDITKQQNAQKELLASEEKYRGIVENAQEGIFQSTAEGRHLTVNSAFARMLGYESPEEVMATITDITQQLYVNPDDRKKLLEFVEEKGSVNNFETEFYKKDGSRIWVSVNMHVVRDDQGRILYYQGIDQDITEQKKMEMERQQNIERLRKSLGATINAMAVTVETRDPYTAGHQRRVANLASAIAVEMKLGRDQTESVRMASMIHDIGKISIPSEILTKPTELTNLEYNLIKTHPESGYNILKDIEFPWPIAQIVLEHHERINGSGYPNGLKGEQMLLESKIIAVADVVEAISSNRPYRPARGLEAALAEISENKGILYEPDITDACLRLFREKNYNLAV